MKRPPYRTHAAPDITQPRQIRALRSPVRSEIIDTVEAIGPCTVADLGRELLRPADALYFHVRYLARVGLLHEIGRQPSPGRGRGGAIYDLQHNNRLQYRLNDRKKVALVRNTIRAMLQVAGDDFAAGLEDHDAVVDGRQRNVWAARAKLWLTDKERRDLVAILERFLTSRGNRRGPDRRLFALSWVFAPVPHPPDEG